LITASGYKKSAQSINVTVDESTLLNFFLESEQHNLKKKHNF